YGDPKIFVFGALLRVLRPGYLPSLAAVNAGDGRPRGFSGLSTAQGKSCFPAHRAVPQPIPACGSSLWICLAADLSHCGSRGLRLVLHQHERLELSERGDLEWVGLAAIRGECGLQRRPPEPTGSDLPEYPSVGFAFVPGGSGYFPDFSAIPGSLHFAGKFADRARDCGEHNPEHRHHVESWRAHTLGQRLRFESDALDGHNRLHRLPVWDDLSALRGAHAHAAEHG